MGTPGRFSPYPANWNRPYKSWTMPDLLISNLLRDTPLPISDLCLYCGHTEPSLRVALATLRRQGRIDQNKKPLLDHPANQALRDTPKLLPLPLPGDRPIPTTQLAHQASARTIATAVLDDSSEIRGHRHFDRAAARAILETWITSGTAGKDTPAFIARWIDLAGADSTGLLPPATPAATCERLLSLLRAISPPLVHSTYSAYLLWLAAPPPLPTPPTEPALERSDDSLKPGETPTLLPLNLPDQIREAEDLGGPDALGLRPDPDHPAILV